ncbi:hypothetical protein [Telmatospirillum siberiense]|uniref:Magnetosome membrane associated protein MmeA n=1 Tax=Telmatospirillum siberiense TaxID=382514 RepID=A0A2N3Q0N9_9PROT|nr:hypothetical protein [Telmatospirillum siberiense]PKU26238.1 hypothetical protein CWS72_03710 [Telmatospirillum siberiense]
MAFTKTHSVAVFAALLLGGCSFTDQALFPPLAQAPDATSSTAGATSAQPSAAVENTYAVPRVSSGQSTGTFVGQKVSSLRNDLQQLQSTLTGQAGQLQQIRNQTVQDSQSYHGTVAAIESRLQVGTTLGNPILVQQWNTAQGALDHINEDVLKMNRLSTDVASTSGLAAYLLDSVRAARSLSGAVDEDHRQLRVLEDETNGTIVMIERLLTDLATDVQRQQQYVSNERSNLNTLAIAIKNGQLYGASLSNVAYANPASLAPGATQATSAAVGSTERPLVVIRFDRQNIAYEDALYTAVKGALDRRPTAVFDVVAVSPSSGSPGTTALGETTARRNAEAVVRSLSQMGLPSDRVRVSSLSSPDATSGEVRVFVR